MEQTNKTLLLAEVNPDAENILNCIHETEQKRSLTDQTIKDMHKKLEVFSFEEFMQKFTPTIYMKLDTDALEAEFSKDHFGAMEEAIRLDHPESLFSMLTLLIDAKQQKNYVLSGFSDMLRNLIPKENITPVLRARDEMIQLLQENDFQVSVKVKNRFKKFCKTYDDGLLLLQTFLQDAVWYADNVKENTKRDKAILKNAEELQVQVMKTADRYKSSSYVLEPDEIKAYEEVFISLFGEMREKLSLRNQLLIQYLFILPAWLAGDSTELLYETYTTYSNFYMGLIKKFWLVSKPLMEVLIGIKEYFAQYRGEGQMRPSLVIANFPLQDLLQEENRRRLDLYLQTINDKNDISDAIWFAILPSIATDRAGRNKVVRERFQATRSPYTYLQRNEAAETALTLELMGKHRILTFMSFEMSDSITFAGYVEGGTQWIANQLQPFERMDGKDYMVPCFPNFVVVSKEEACMSMGVALERDEASGALRVSEEKNIWLDEVGIEASYVAAGMYAACQCPQHLNVFYKNKVNLNLPGVGYRFSEEGHHLITYTNMLSDTVEYSEEVMQDGMIHSKGILFGQVDGKVVLLTDRTFAYGHGNQMLVSMVHTSTYMERIIKIETQDFKKNLIKQFFSKRPDSLINNWYLAQVASVNSLLKKEEKLDYTIDEEDGSCTISIYFTNHGYVRNETVEIFKE